MSLPRLYLETTIPSYLVARRSPLARIAADQQTTQDWWENRRHDYEFFVSAVVLDEVAEGDAEMARKRREVIAGLPELAQSPEADALTRDLLASGIIPAVAAPDAAHLALAAVHAMNFLLTWNCTHLNNPRLSRRIEAACRAAGSECPIICSPADLLAT